MDVQSLYTCIPHEAGIQAVREFMSSNQTYSGPPSEFLISLLEFILYNNYFKFESDFFLQLTGTAMGSNVAPTYANIFMHKYETNNIYGHALFRKYGGYFRRYIDDLFFLWYGTKEELDIFVNDLNSLPSPIRFTVHSDASSIQFLDVTVYKDEEHQQLHTKIYQKPTDRNSLLHYSSSHPRHLLNSLPRSQMMRVVRITSDVEERGLALENMACRFLERGYPSKLIKDIKEWAGTLDREEVLRGPPRKVEDRSNDIYYMTTFDARTPLIKSSILQHWPIVKSDHDLTALNRKRVCFGHRRNRNLKELLSPTDPATNSSIHTLAKHIPSSRGSRVHLRTWYTL
ncbi:uncharacterized protein LOC121395530 [Xenopus laevis]|uniref:Uncharacterized protein LOC121395530 n=1 Tax=Xenopus laevis TaxID=8355 RepID=A0A8J1L6F3_XENLA|nr:uncharacterized protein LOC121395530 [Xenopus laevis]